MLSTGRTCRHPTDACAYQVPSVPCLWNTSVSRAVYSARCSSGTAQSSMKDTGFPSPFMDIMMLRPALRTFHSDAWPAASSTSTTAPGKPRSPMRSPRPRTPRTCGSRSAPANSTRRMAPGSPFTKRRMTGANEGLPSARSSILRSTSSTAQGPSFTMCCAASIASWKRGKCTTPSALWRGSCARRRWMRSNHASVPSLPTSSFARLKPSGAMRSRLYPATRRATFGSRAAISSRSRAQSERAFSPSARIAGSVIAASSPKRPRTPLGSQASIASTRSTMLPYASERDPHELLPAMPPSVACAEVETSTGYHRPRGRSCAFSASRTSPGSTTARDAAASTSSVRFRYLLSSITRAAPTACPHCEVAAPRGRIGTPSSTATCIARTAASAVRGTTTPTGVTW